MTERGIRKGLTGFVVGNQMDKTAVILVTQLKKHKIYKKYVKSHTKYLAHDPQNKCQVGDKVRIIESKPISKMKRWQILEISETAVVSEPDNLAKPLEQAK